MDATFVNSDECVHAKKCKGNAAPVHVHVSGIWLLYLKKLHVEREEETHILEILDPLYPVDFISSSENLSNFEWKTILLK